MFIEPWSLRNDEAPEEQNIGFAEVHCAPKELKNSSPQHELQTLGRSAAKARL